MAEAFRLGGWGMWPTLFIGVLLLLAAAAYAFKPERRLLPLLLSLGLMTFISGALGFVTGVICSFQAIGQVGPSERYVVVIGVAESLYNVAFALLLLMLASLAGGVGALRLSRRGTAVSRAGAPAG